MTIIRAATTGDIPAIAALHVEGWRAAYGGAVDEAYLNAITIERRIADWQGWMAAGDSATFVAMRDGKAAGFVTVGRTRTPPPGSSPIRPSHAAEIYALYLDPARFREGIGGALLRHAAADAKARRQSSLCLWVLDANNRAKSFYAAMGGQKLGGKDVEIGGSRVREICFGWKDSAAMIGNT